MPPTTPQVIQTNNTRGDLPQDLGILRTVARYNQVHVGVYASVERGRTIHRGDTIRLKGK
jgi:uncharacterized protein